MASSTYPDAKVIALSRNFVNLIGDKDTGHGTKDVIVGREKKKFCKEYWGIPCEQHVKCYEAQQKFEFPGGTIGMPMNICCDPSGKELEAPKRKYSMGSSELVKFLDEALKQVPGEKIPYQPWADCKKLMTDGDAAFEKGEFKKSIETYNKVVKLKQKKLAAKGDEALKKVQEKGAELLEEAKGKIESEKDEAKKLLKKIVDDFKPLECSKKAAEALKSLDEKK